MPSLKDKILEKANKQTQEKVKTKKKKKKEEVVVSSKSNKSKK